MEFLSWEGLVYSSPSRNFYTGVEHGARSVTFCDMIMWYDFYDYVISSTVIIADFMIWL